ncbi:MAG: peptide MFS transporter [Lachnospiraceae bacterium]|jgi:dipeptide/tripeptide permease|nr:peptide MFS transporter [Lachnospiraceae bacterium]
METTKTKRPFGFYVMSTCFTFERMGYYAAKWLVNIFIMTAVVEGGLGLSKGTAGIMQSNLVAYTYIAPIIGGYIADRFIGARICIPIGQILMGVGYICAFFATDLKMVWVMIILVSIGTGLFKGNISAINGRLFSDPDELDSAFSIQYSFVNIGSFIGTTLVGILVVQLGHNGAQAFRTCFLLSGCAVLLGFVWYMCTQRALGNVGKKPFKYEERLGDDEAKDEEIEKDYKNVPLTRNEKNRVLAIILVSLFSVVFWIFWYLAYLPVYDYWATNANWIVGSIKASTAWFDSENAALCIILGPIMAMVWNKLASRPQGDMSLFKKSAFALAIMGCAYLVFFFADITRGGGKAPLLWIVLFGILLSLGEMFFSPLGNSFVSKYSPAKYLSVMMGVWTFATFISAKTYGYIYDFILKHNFARSMMVIAIISFVCAIILFVVNKPLSGLVEE